MIIDEAAERKGIASDRAINDFTPITNADVWNQVARNLGRITERQSATAAMRAASDVQTGTLKDRCVGAEPAERATKPKWTVSMDIRQRRQAEAPAMHRVKEQMRSATQRVVQQARRGPRP